MDDLGGDIGTISGWSITFKIEGVRWSPVTGLFLDPSATVPYVANTLATTVYAKPATTTTYTATRVNGTCISAGTSVVVTVFQNLSITTQPASQTVCIGSNATFSLVIAGNPQNYQWQISTDAGATWNNIPGANNATLVLPSVTAAMTGNRYRVIASNGCSTVTSSGATLTTAALTGVTANPVTEKICISDTLVPLSGTPVGGSWSGIGVSGNNFVPPVTAVGTYTLTYRYVNTAGCASTSTISVKVEDCPERFRNLTEGGVQLFPNPNNGNFNIRINSVLYNYITMKVFTTTGQLVYSKNYSGLVYNRVLPVNLSMLPGGVYMVQFYYEDGVRTSDKTFKVIVNR